MIDHTITQGKLQIASGANQLTTASTSGSIVVFCPSLNSGTTYIGNSSVVTSGGTNEGFPIAPGGTFRMDDVTDLSALYVRGTTSDNVNWLALSP